MLARRDVLKSLAGLSLAAVLADPGRTLAAAREVAPLVLRTPSGREVAGALALPTVTPAPVVILVHEWWGLNDQIKAVAATLAEEGYIALALDLFDGQMATTPDEARALVAAVVPDQAAETVAAWVAWARNRPDGNGGVGLIGWCFGGGWALSGSTLAPVEATVVYYGKCDLPAERLARLAGPVLGHFGTRDVHIDRAMVGRFEAAMVAAHKPYTVHWYEADHAFANPTGSNYDRPEAQLAWQRTVDFLARQLRG